jgi:hypothetical protein
MTGWLVSVFHHPVGAEDGETLESFNTRAILFRLSYIPQAYDIKYLIKCGKVWFWWSISTTGLLCMLGHFMLW